MRQAMSANESIRTRDEIEQEDRMRQRMAVIREFIESKAKKNVRNGAN